jgi:hypothetical protein
MAAVLLLMQTARSRGKGGWVPAWDYEPSPRHTCQVLTLKVENLEATYRCTGCGSTYRLVPKEDT